MTPLSLIDMSGEVADRYCRYLQTTFYFRDPNLRTSFAEALASQSLAKGPYLEATPVFRRGLSARDLCRQLGVAPDDGFMKAIQGDRFLYSHQEDAIRKASNGRNIVVATGTGSGKTESFLIPILLHLYREFEVRKLSPGVRALILYPMNALTNDQRDRLGEISSRLEKGGSSFRFTFGQYIGETPEHEKDSHRHAQDYLHNRFPGELVFRRQMWETPPHILLTNYSMLEYLLLRPYDSPLFEQDSARLWTFLVLDEAHQYRGTRGMEMAMLLRRLKQRLREEGRNEPFRCIATSATLLGGDSDRQTAAQFASDLFGEPFNAEDVIIGEPESIPEKGSYSLSREDYRVILDAMSSDPVPVCEPLYGLAGRLSVGVPQGGGPANIAGIVLAGDERSTQLRRLIAGQPRDVREVAATVFPDVPKEEQIEALDSLVRLLVWARDPGSRGDNSQTSPSLLAARYHLFLRSLEGAFICYLPEKRISLDRREVDGYASFEVALCKECGQHYIVGKIDGGHRGGQLIEAIRDPGHPDFGATFFRPMEGPVNEGQNDDEDPNEADTRQVFCLCLRCRAIWREGFPARCNHSSVLRVEKQDTTEEREDQIPRCTACGYRGSDPVREVVHGSDGPNVVIATTLHRKLPSDRRKILAFADGRQEAAFFAWYLDQSYQDILYRNLILGVARNLNQYASEGLSLKDLAGELHRSIQDKSIAFPEATAIEVRRLAWRAIFREFLAEQKRLSLEGVGLGYWSLKWPDWFHIPEVLLENPWALTENEARDLLFLLIDSMRTDRAVELQIDEQFAISWDELGLLPQNRFRIGPGNRSGVKSWDGPTTGRAKFLKKLLLQRGLSERDRERWATDALSEIWQEFSDYDRMAPSGRSRFMFPAANDGRRLNPGWWRFRAFELGDRVFRCDTCGRIQRVSVLGLCARWSCTGKLFETRSHDLEPNHYRDLYETDLPASLRVEEHTAQLAREKAREYQSEFKNDRIHVLSCSTTFELGVDLGNLDTIFLRNVPPEAFNYAQRVGRAGRRPGHPGFAITYCRRSPHDLYHFAEPGRMVRGLTKPPLLTLCNEKIILRHMAAVALSRFFRHYPHRFTSVEAFVRDLGSPSALSDFRQFVEEHKEELQEALCEIVAQEMRPKLGLSDGRWLDLITYLDPRGTESRFAQAEAELASDYRCVKKLEGKSSEEGDYQRADWARRRARTLAKEDVLSWLSRKAVIPKYGFPVDVVELDTQRSGYEAEEVELERDLGIAIAEYAPTSQLVANKKLWTSYGVKIVAERAWEMRHYRKCSEHNRFDVWKNGEQAPGEPCCSLMSSPRHYVIPRFGFVTSPDRPRDPTGRPIRMFSTRPYFIGLSDQDQSPLMMPGKTPLISVTKACPGWMAVICEGRRGEGFFICQTCGAGFRERKSPHRTPQGQDCRGTPSPFTLGHEFLTDVLGIRFLTAAPLDTDLTWFAYSLAYALAGGASEVLEVPAVDLNTTVTHGEGENPQIVLYDNVPGGAGLVARLEDEDRMLDCLHAALERVSGRCGCGENESCYGCLRSYTNQFAHHKLERGPVKSFLADTILRWKEGADDSR